MNFDFQTKLPGNSGILTTTVNHGNRKSDDAPVLAVEVTARSARQIPPSMPQWFDTAHDVIVNTFDNMVTDEAKGLWGKKDAE